MPKYDATKLIFNNTNAFRDYKKLEKLSFEYERAKTKKNIKLQEKLQKEIIILLPDTLTGIQRLARLYGKAYETMIEDTSIYKKTDAQSFIQKLNEMENKIKTIKAEFENEMENKIKTIKAEFEKNTTPLEGEGVSQ